MSVKKLIVVTLAGLFALPASSATAQSNTEQSILERQRALIIKRRNQQGATRSLVEIAPKGQTAATSSAASNNEAAVVSSTNEPSTKPAARQQSASRQQVALKEVPPQLAPEDQLFRPVKFEYDSAFLTEEARAILDDLCGTLRLDLNLNPGSSYYVIGHTDAAGSAAYNERLSRRRADATKQYLVKNCGITTAQLKAVGMGEERLFASNDPTAAVNRRVEIQVRETE